MTRALYRLTPLAAACLDSRVSTLVLLLAAFSACGGESVGSGSRGRSGQAGAPGAGAGGGTGGFFGGSGGTDPTACSESYECVVTAATCCGGHNPPTVADLTALNSAHLEDFTAPCQLVDCVSTIGSIPPHFGATCSAGHCVAFDVRGTKHTACTTSEECVLRNGLGCCEGCTTGSEHFVALRSDTGITDLVCGSGSVGCPACSTFAEGFSAACRSGNCEVLLQPR